MLIGSFFTWWYGEGWKQILKSLDLRVKIIADFFSIRLLLRTLTAPWKQIISYSGTSLDSKFRAMIDNLFSRAVGLVVRTLVLLLAIISIVIVGLLTIVEMILWPILPISVPASLIIGFTL